MSSLSLIHEVFNSHRDNYITHLVLSYCRGGEKVLGKNPILLNKNIFLPFYLAKPSFIYQQSLFVEVGVNFVKSVCVMNRV